MLWWHHLRPHSALLPLSSGTTCPSFSFFFFFYLQVEDLQWFARSLTLSSIFLKYRREAEDNLRVPPRGADKDKDHQFHSRGDDAFTQ